MSWRPQLNVVCGRCGKPRGLMHECVSNSRRKQTLKPKVTFGTCPKCRKPQGNPLTHVCAPKSDFKRRKAAHDKAERAAPARSASSRTTTTPPAPTTTASALLCVAYKTGWKQATRPDTTAAGATAGSRATTGASPTASPPARAPTSKEDPVTQVLLVLGATAGYALFLLMRPTKACRRAPAGARKAAAAVLPRCGGTGNRFRLGARLLYRAISAYRRHRANGNLTLPPLQPPRRRTRPEPRRLDRP